MSAFTKILIALLPIVSGFCIFSMVMKHIKIRTSIENNVLSISTGIITAKTSPTITKPDQASLVKNQQIIDATKSLRQLRISKAKHSLLDFNELKIEEVQAYMNGSSPIYPTTTRSLTINDVQYEITFAIYMFVNQNGKSFRFLDLAINPLIKQIPTKRYSITQKITDSNRKAVFAKILSSTTALKGVTEEKILELDPQMQINTFEMQAEGLSYHVVCQTAGLSELAIITPIVGKGILAQQASYRIYLDESR